MTTQQDLDSYPIARDTINYTFSITGAELMGHINELCTSGSLVRKLRLRDVPGWKVGVVGDPKYGDLLVLSDGDIPFIDPDFRYHGGDLVVVNYNWTGFDNEFSKREYKVISGLRAFVADLESSILAFSVAETMPNYDASTPDFD